MRLSRSGTPLSAHLCETVGLTFELFSNHWVLIIIRRKAQAKSIKMTRQSSVLTDRLWQKLPTKCFRISRGRNQTLSEFVHVQRNLIANFKIILLHQYRDHCSTNIANMDEYKCPLSGWAPNLNSYLSNISFPILTLIMTTFHDSCNFSIL